jgi:PleD family two-component response regulator
MKGPRKKIIYVDDVFHSLLTLKNKLKEHYEVFLVQTPDNMFKTLSKVEMDLILLDVNMPNMDGFEVLAKLKNNPYLAHIPVIFLSSQTDKEAMIKGLSLGADDYVSKLAAEKELIERIEFHLDPKQKAAIKPVILAIDDDPSILQAVSHLLSDKYTVYTMPGVSGEKMIKGLLQKVVPDLFLLDCHMPILNGFELVPIIRKMSNHTKTPIVFLTSDGTPDNVYVAISNNASDFMLKPIDKAILREKMAHHLKNFMTLRLIRTVEKS